MDLIPTLLTTLLLSQDSLGCGISTHTEIGYRAIQYLASAREESSLYIRDILLNHQVEAEQHIFVSVKVVIPRTLSKLVTRSLTVFTTLFATTGSITTRARTHTGATMSRWLLITSTGNTPSPGLRRLKN